VINCVGGSVPLSMYLSPSRWFDLSFFRALSLPITLALYRALSAGYRALFTGCGALFTGCTSLFTGYRALFVGYRALFIGCRALFTGCRALSTGYRALFGGSRALFISCRPLLIRAHITYLEGGCTQIGKGGGWGSKDDIFQGYLFRFGIYVS